MREIEQHQANKQRAVSDHSANEDLHLYWLDKDEFIRAKSLLEYAGYKLTSTKMTPCQVLRASGSRVVYAPPEIWSRVCVRQGSWYRASKRAGQYMMMSEGKLPEQFGAYLDATLAASAFEPGALPTAEELMALVESQAYQNAKPAEWENKSFMDAIMFKLLFTLTRIWKRGDTLKKHWLTHKANHANFVARQFTTEIDGEDVAYSVSDNAGICSSCVEYFNIVDDKSRKLVKACPGAITFGGAKRGEFLDVKPVV